MRRFLPILAVLLAACGGSAPPEPPLASGAITSESIGVATGKPATWADVVLVNRGKQPLTFRSIVPVSVAAGLRVVGVRIRVLGANGDASGDPNPAVSGSGFPPSGQAGGPVAGTRLDPVAGNDLRPQAEILVGLTADSPGHYVLRGLRIGYRVNGVDDVGTVTHAVALCVTDPGDQPGACEPPPLTTAAG
jgi:hypothetical protein